MTVDSTPDTLTRRLLALRRDGHWEGELSSSALSTATAVVALALARAPGDDGLVRQGLAWLARNRNTDGGWGDTTRSRSNISTTALCWAALAFAGGQDQAEQAAAGAEDWLCRAAGSLAPKTLARAIAARYGKDRTFSVPILTMLALSGRLGAAHEAWVRVPQLPFELAACPRQWFRWLRLPVVSYALPALIAIGVARHSRRPTWNPILRLARGLTRRRVLRILRQIQPEGGGFLEATPLTSFVVMSLVAAGEGQGPVVRAGLQFLRRSVRSDGAWPIDTNLATWVTTLSINSLALRGDFDRTLPRPERAPLLDWLLGQQYRVRHPYTGAAPGGWAWTDLPGGVPDADDTAGALLALRHLAAGDPRVREAAAAGVRWLLELQNRDGGMPTFCRGWGWLPFDRSGADLTAHALQAWVCWREELPDEIQPHLQRAVRQASYYLRSTQRPDGSWLPLWFGNEHVPDDENPLYGTARVLAALRAVDRSRAADVADMAATAQGWLLRSQNSDGGWGGAAGAPSSIEETGLALCALAGGGERTRSAVTRGTAWLVEHTRQGSQTPPSPIGFYFARLWYHEQLYPLIFAHSGLWSAAAQLPPADPRR